MNSIDLHIIDIVHNSIRAGAGKIGISIVAANQKLKISIEDNGCGIPAEKLNQVIDPYCTSRTERKVGLGLPLLKFHAELTEGTFSINSIVGEGTKVEACFNTNHHDCQPTGDIAGTLARFICQFPETKFILQITNDSENFETSSIELKDALGFNNRFSNQDYILIKELLQAYIA